MASVRRKSGRASTRIPELKELMHADAGIHTYFVTAIPA